MDIALLATLVMFLMIATLFLRPSRQGHRRRLHDLTAKLTASPSSTVVMGLPFVGRRHIVTADPENVQHVMKTNFPNYPKGWSFRSTLDDLFGDCIVNADGHTWRTQRVFAARQFSTSFLQFYGDSVLDSEISQRLLPFLAKAADEARVIDLQDLLLRFAHDNICRATFSHDPESLSASALPPSEFSESFDKAVLLLSFRIKNLLPPTVLRIKKALNIGGERKLKTYVRAVKRIAMAIVKEKLHKLKEGNINNSRADEETDQDVDFLTRLMKPRTASSSNRDLPTDDEFRINMVAGVILAGRDTTSAALTWFFWLLGNDPRVEAKILDEIKNGSQASAYEASCSRAMPYTHAAICEAMRLYPPIAMVIKEVQKDDVLPDGTRVRGGDSVMIVHYAMGRVERIWGSDWACFRPERWLDRDGRFVGRDPFKYPIFNAGPRICLGKEMAFVQMKRVIAAILPSFRVVPDASTINAEYVFDLTAKMKGGFPVTVQHRRP